MKNYRKNNIYTDEEINLFQEQEINKTLSNTSTSIRSKSIFRYAGALTLVVLIVLTIILTTGNDDPVDYLNIQQISATEFSAQSSVDGSLFYFYYDAYIVQESEKIKYNDRYEYNQQYTYAPQDLQDNISIDFDIFKYNEYRHFLETSINGEKTYYEIDSFPAYMQSIKVEGLEIDDFEVDIREMYYLINQYPPVCISKEYNSSYEPHPDIQYLEDSKAKRNYITYVQNNYAYEFEFENDDPSSEATTSTWVLSNLIILDETGLITESKHHSGVYGGSHVSLDSISDLADNSFSFYIIGDDKVLRDATMTYKNDDQNIVGTHTLFTDLELSKKFAYFSFDTKKSNTDLSSVSKIEFTFEAHGIYGEPVEQSVTMDFITYRNFIITGPIEIAESDQPNIVSYYRYYSFKLLDHDNQIIYELDSRDIK